MLTRRRFTSGAGGAVLAFALAASSASATTYYVNQSTPGATNASPCTDTALPCKTVNGGLAKVTSDGDVVRVLPDPNGFVDVYDENILITAAKKITLEGAGMGAGGTKIAPAVPATTVLDVGAGSTVSGVHVVGGQQNAVAASSGVLLDHVLVENPFAVAVRLFGEIRDSRLVGTVGLQMQGGSVLRTRIEGTVVGVGPVNPGSMFSVLSGQLFSSLITGPASTGTGIDQSSNSLGATVALRHVTVRGFAVRARVGGYTELDAVNTTLGGDGTTKDLQLTGTAAKGSLIAVNRSPLRTTVAAGGTIEELSPVDVDPGLTDDGHLAASSALIDRGLMTGYFAADPRDALDLDGEPRLQGPAPDIGADEFTVPPPVTPTPPPVTPPVVAPLAPVITKPKAFRATTAFRFPSSKRCLKRTSKLTLAYRKPTGFTIDRVEVWTGKRRLVRRSGRKSRASITLRRLPAKAFALTIKVTPRGAPTVSAKKTYKVCTR